MANPTKSKPAVKVAKPYSGFPLTPHPSGRWCKKIRGRIHYFGKIDAPEVALERFNREWPFLQDGRTPPPIDTGDGCTVRLLCNAFLTSKKAKLDTGELSRRTFSDYFKICELLIKHLERDRRVDDLRPDDFARLRLRMANRWGHVRMRNEISRARVVFKFAIDERLIDRPVYYGQSFDLPSAKTIRKVQNEGGSKMFTADECRRIFGTADVQLKAMTLLGLNCGFGNTDCATFPETAIDFEDGWLEFPRPKTAIQRRIPLWAETRQALVDAIAARPKAKDPDDKNLMFVTRTGARWVRVQKHRTKTTDVSLDAISQAFSKLLKSLEINGHRNFYTLRHNFETIAGESKDQVAVDAIMGHVDTSMAAAYRERISDERLRAVTEHVRNWLFNTAGPLASAQLPVPVSDEDVPLGLA